MSAAGDKCYFELRMIRGKHDMKIIDLPPADVERADAALAAYDADRALAALTEEQRRLGMYDEAEKQEPDVPLINEGDRLDAERYRELRPGRRWSVIDWIGNDLRGDVLDAAIDKAIAAKEAKPC